MALSFGATEAGVLSPAEATSDDLLFVLLFSVSGSILAYVATRQVLGVSKLAPSNGDTATKPEAGNDEGSSGPR